MCIYYLNLFKISQKIIKLSLLNNISIRERVKNTKKTFNMKNAYKMKIINIKK